MPRKRPRGVFPAKPVARELSSTDAISIVVYAVSLYALDRSARWMAGAALLKGLLIFALGAGVAINVIAKIESGVAPSSTLMLLVGGLALLANLACLRLLWRFRSHDVNMTSTFECSRNDVISSIGVLLAAGLVALFDSPWPDIAIGSAMALLFLRSAVRVTAQAARGVARGLATAAAVPAVHDESGMTEPVRVDRGCRRMPVRRPVARFKAIAMLLLFAAALLGASVDALACEPEFEISGAVIAHTDDGQSQQSDHKDRGEGCIHGHGHPGSQVLPRSDEFVAQLHVRAAFGLATPPSLRSLPGETPEHPPRA